MTSPSGVPEHPYQFDATSLFPGIAASLSLIMYDILYIHLIFQFWKVEFVLDKAAIECGNMEPFPNIDIEDGQAHGIRLDCTEPKLSRTCSRTGVFKCVLLPYRLGSWNCWVCIKWDASDLLCNNLSNLVHRGIIIHNLLWPSPLRFPIF